MFLFSNSFKYNLSIHICKAIYQRETTPVANCRFYESNRHKSVQTCICDCRSLSVFGSVAAIMHCKNLTTSRRRRSSSPLTAAPTTNRPIKESSISIRAADYSHVLYILILYIIYTYVCVLLQKPALKRPVIRVLSCNAALFCCNLFIKIFFSQALHKWHCLYVEIIERLWHLHISALNLGETS